MERGSRANISEIKKFYESLLSSGDIDDMYPQTMGNWEDDKKGFVKYYLETIALELDIDEDIFNSLEPSHLRNFKDELGIDED